MVTRQTDYQAPGCMIAQDLNRAIISIPTDESEAFIIGGGQLYQEGISLAGRIYLTVIPRDIHGDTFFPEIPEADFEIKKSKFIDGPQPYHFYIYERVTSER